MNPDPESATSDVSEDELDYQVGERSPEYAIEIIDTRWYRTLAKYARWMDLIGDYAGAERFALDGEIVIKCRDSILSLFYCL
jgi:hypothetical protein